MFRNRFLYLLLCIGMLYFAILYNERVTMLIFLMIVIFPLISTVLMRVCARKVEIRLYTEPTVVRRGEECSVIIRIRNQSILPVSKLQFQLGYLNSIYGIKEEKNIALSFLGKSMQEIKLHLTPEASGNLVLILDDYVIWDYSRCTRIRRKAGIKSDIMVLPKEYVLEEKLQTGSMHLFENESVLLSKPGSDMTEILNIREYTQGDRISKIHWKLSSKCDELMIREYASPLYYYPLFLMDVRKTYEEDNHEYMEAVYEAFLSLASLHIEHNQPIEVAYFETESNALRKQIVTTRDELYTVFHELYNNSYENKNSQSLRSFYVANELHLYSNVIYFSCSIENDIEVLEKLNIFTFYFTSGKLEEDTKEKLIGQLGIDGFTTINIYGEQSEITKAAHVYLKGSRGEEFGE